LFNEGVVKRKCTLGCESRTALDLMGAMDDGLGSVLSDQNSEWSNDMLATSSM